MSSTHAALGLLCCPRRLPLFLFPVVVRGWTKLLLAFLRVNMALRVKSCRRARRLPSPFPGAVIVPRPDAALAFVVTTHDRLLASWIIWGVYMYLRPCFLLVAFSPIQP